MKNLEQLKAQYEALGKEIEKLEKEGEYPRYFKWKKSNLIVKFTGITNGIVVFPKRKDNVGGKSDYWISHRDQIDWQELPICPKTGLYDTQLVWAWDDNDGSYRVLSFYDSKNNCLFSQKGIRNAVVYDNYEPFTGKIESWMIEGYSKLKVD